MKTLSLLSALLLAGIAAPMFAQAPAENIALNKKYTISKQPNYKLCTGRKSSCKRYTHQRSGIQGDVLYGRLETVPHAEPEHKICLWAAGRCLRIVWIQQRGFWL